MVAGFCDGDETIICVLEAGMLLRSERVILVKNSKLITAIPIIERYLFCIVIVQMKCNVNLDDIQTQKVGRKRKCFDVITSVPAHHHDDDDNDDRQFREPELVSYIELKYRIVSIVVELVMMKGNADNDNGI